MATKFGIYAMPIPLGFGVSYSLTIGKSEKGFGKRGEIFVTNPEIHRRIEKIMQNSEERELLSRPRHNRLGTISYEVHPETRKIISDWHYPFLRMDTVSGIIVKKLSRIGLATLAELAIERDLLKKYPGYTIESTKKPSLDRKMQLRKMGRKPGEPIPLEKTIELTRAKVIAGHKKWKRKNRRKTRVLSFAKRLTRRK